mmetsp:Transcript_49469/g.143480  ORF Transcript_49469/g.143480 Transcript_49469/m.143480 type:complete len:290 (-) Transcript_49469:606-1475(-)
MQQLPRVAAGQVLIQDLQQHLLALGVGSLHAAGLADVRDFPGHAAHEAQDLAVKVGVEPGLQQLVHGLQDDGHLVLALARPHDRHAQDAARGNLAAAVGCLVEAGVFAGVRDGDERLRRDRRGGQALAAQVCGVLALRKREALRHGHVAGAAGASPHGLAEIVHNPHPRARAAQQRHDLRSDALEALEVLGEVHHPLHRLQHLRQRPVQAPKSVELTAKCEDAVVPDGLARYPRALQEELHVPSLRPHELREEVADDLLVADTHNRQEHLVRAFGAHVILFEDGVIVRH